MLRIWDPRTRAFSQEGLYVPRTFIVSAACASIIECLRHRVHLSRRCVSSCDRCCRRYCRRCRAHEGVKCFKLTWLGDSNNVLTAGFTKQSKREFKIFDLRAGLACVPTHTGVLVSVMVQCFGGGAGLVDWDRCVSA
jgi:hypothetical protein